MKIHFHGCGDAFGSGGRFHTCFQLVGERLNCLIDCGASSLITLKANQVALNEIDTILITHFHADHFGGIPFFMLDAQFISKRKRPLTIAGPPGLKNWFERVLETSFLGSAQTKPRFPLTLLELEARQTIALGTLQATPYPVKHGAPPDAYFAYRLQAEGRVIAYTGDSEWTDSLIEAGYKADLLIAEAYFYNKKVPFHLDYTTLIAKLPLIKPKRLVLTHMSIDMLAKASTLSHEAAYDGQVISLH